MGLLTPSLSPAPFESRVFGSDSAVDKLKDPFGKKPEKPQKTAEELATERRTRSLLDKEIQKGEKLLKSQARGQLGRVSLLSGAPTTVEEAARGGFSRGGDGGVNVLGVNARTAGKPRSLIRDRGR